MIKAWLRSKHNTTKLKLQHHHTPALAHYVALCLDGKLGGRCFFLMLCPQCKTTHWPPSAQTLQDLCVYARVHSGSQKNTPLVGEMNLEFQADVRSHGWLLLPRFTRSCIVFEQPAIMIIIIFTSIKYQVCMLYEITECFRQILWF